MRTARCVTADGGSGSPGWPPDRRDGTRSPHRGANPDRTRSPERAPRCGVADCLIAHGASALMLRWVAFFCQEGFGEGVSMGEGVFRKKTNASDPPSLQERLLWKSDAYRMSLCSACGRAMCHTGGACTGCLASAPRGDAVGVVVPYSFKLLLQTPGARRAACAAVQCSAPPGPRKSRRWASTGSSTRLRPVNRRAARVVVVEGGRREPGGRGHRGCTEVAAGSAPS